MHITECSIWCGHNEFQYLFSQWNAHLGGASCTFSRDSALCKHVDCSCASSHAHNELAFRFSLRVFVEICPERRVQFPTSVYRDLIWGVLPPTCCWVLCSLSCLFLGLFQFLFCSHVTALLCYFSVSSYECENTHSHTHTHAHSLALSLSLSLPPSPDITYSTTERVLHLSPPPHTLPHICLC